MRILLTNDDGIEAKGINSLYNALSKEHEVYVIAPHEEKSACSNAITIRGDLVIHKKIDNTHFAVEGFPADCIHLGLHGDFIPEVDMIISGINHGPNMGTDIYYSGTTAGARAGFILGKSGIAVSLSSFDSLEFIDDAAEFISEFLKEKDLLVQDKPFFYNINYPAIPREKIKGVDYCFLGERSYTNIYKVVKESEEKFHVEMNGTLNPQFLEGSDELAVQKDYISITPMTLDATDYKTLEKLKNKVNIG